jgi:hypothetical protein
MHGNIRGCLQGAQLLRRDVASGGAGYGARRSPVFMVFSGWLIEPLASRMFPARSGRLA